MCISFFVCLFGQLVGFGVLSGKYICVSLRSTQGGQEGLSHTQQLEL